MKNSFGARRDVQSDIDHENSGRQVEGGKGTESG